LESALETLFPYALRIPIAEQMKDAIWILPDLALMASVLRGIPAVFRRMSDKIIYI
jgi:hypothetical protein